MILLNLKRRKFLYKVALSLLVNIVIIVALCESISFNQTTIKTPNQRVAISTWQRNITDSQPLKRSNRTAHARSYKDSGYSDDLDETSNLNQEATSGDSERLYGATAPATGRHQALRSSAADVQRVARNVHKKMDLLDSRVDQIQATIAENHRDNATGSNSADEHDTYGRRSDKSVNEPTVSSAVISNNLEAPSTETNDGLWSTQMSDSDDNQLDPNRSTRTADSTTNLDHNRGLSVRRNTPIIQSVIPGRAPSSSSTTSAPMSDNLQSGGQDQSEQDRNYDSNESADGTSEANNPAYNATSQDSYPEPNGTAENQAAAPQTYTPSLTLSQNSSATTNQAPVETPQALPSMMGPEWTPNQNYQYFSELNAKNHGTRNQVAASGREDAAFKPLVGQLTRRFPNMTIVNSETDLINSFSSNQVSPSSHTTRRPSGQAPDRIAASSAPAKSHVFTYSGSNYGKSSKATNRPNVAGQHHHHQEANNDTLSDAQSPIKWPTFATSYSSSASNNKDSSSVGLQPTMGSPSSNHYSMLMQPASLPGNNNHQQDSSGRSNRANYNSDEANDRNRNKFSNLLTTASEQNSLGTQYNGANGGNFNADSNLYDLKHRSSGGPNGNQNDDSIYSYGNNMDSNSLIGGGNESPASSSPQVGDLQPTQASADQNASDQSNDNPTVNSNDYQSSQQNSQQQQQVANLPYQPPNRLQPQQSVSLTGQNQDNRNYYATQPLDGNSNGALDYGNGAAQNSLTGDSTVTIDTTGDGLAPDPTRLYQAALAAARLNQAQLQHQQQQQQQQQQQSDSMQFAATSNTNNLLMRQQNQLAAQNPPFDANNFLRRYQQQQQLLAMQLAQQQQQQQQQVDATQTQSASVYPTNPNPLSRAFHVSAQGDSGTSGAMNRESHSVARRFSPETIASYLASRASNLYQPQAQVPSTEFGQVSAATSGDLMPYTLAAGGQQYNQPASAVYGAAQPNYDAASRAIRAANSAFYRAIAQAAATRTQQSQQQQQLDGQSAYYGIQPSAGGSANLNSNANSGLYATAAMNSPVFYDASASQPKSSYDSGASVASGGATNGDMSANQQQRQYSSGSSSPVTGRRSYLNNLFKPTASSRFYYTPTYLSPISFAASPTSLHSIYAPTMTAAASDPMASLTQFYAAANPYAALAQPQLAAASSPMVDQSQQYQAYAAAAAAANGMQPHYMDTEMAESSLMPSDTSAGAYGAGGGSSGSSSESSSSGSGEEPQASSSSTSKSSKSTTTWSSVAGLLLGILPFGILMASLLPAVTVAGRKKRELEIGGRNFSDLLSWRPPSKVLNAIIGQPTEMALANATAVINEQLANLGNKRSNQQHNSQTRRRSLTSSSNPVNLIRGLVSGKPAVYDHTGGSSDSNATTLGSPSPTTTPLPMNGAQSNQTGSVKAKVKKAFSALNNFITAAQNMKRKHRSSIIDQSWTLPTVLKNSLKLDNMFNFEEFKQTLASLARAKLLAAQREQLVGQQRAQHQQHENEMMNQGQQRVETRHETQVQRPIGPDHMATRSNMATQPPQRATPVVTKQEAPEQSATTTTPLSIAFTVDDNGLQSTNGSRAQSERIMTYETHQATSLMPPANSLQSADFQDLASEETDRQVVAYGHLKPKPSPVEQPKQQPAKTSNSTMQQLEVCLNQFLCRLAVKLNNNLGMHLAKENQEAHKSMNSTADEEVENLTKKYITILVKKIESEHPNVSLNLGPKLKDNETTTNGSEGLDTLYKSAMKNQCAQMYKCVALSQLERTLEKMKLRFS